MPDPIALSPKAAAAMLGLSTKTVGRLIRRKAIKARKSGPRVLIDYKSLVAFFASLPVAK